MAQSASSATGATQGGPPPPASTQSHTHRPRGSRQLDAASAWQQQQQLSALAAAVAALPAADALPLTVTRELGRVLALLQRYGDGSDAAAGATTNSSSLVNLDEGAALQLAGQHTQQRLLQRVAPAPAVAACVHAHLFAAWVKGEGGRALGLSTSSSSSGSAAALAGEATAAAAAAAGRPPPVVSPDISGLGPTSHWQLSSRQYAALVHQLGMLPLLLDALAWLQAPGWQQQQQQAQVQAQDVQLLLLLQAARGSLPLSAQLLLHVLSLPAEHARSDITMHPCAVALLLSLWAAGSDAAASSISAPADRAVCLQALCCMVNRLLPACSQQQQQQQSSVMLPTALVCSLARGRQSHPATSSGLKQQAVQLSSQQLLATALQLLQDVLLAWGPMWFEATAATAACSRSTLAASAVHSVLAHLTHVQRKLQAQLLPQLLAAAGNDGNNTSSSSSGDDEGVLLLLEQLNLLQLAHQVAAHTSSRIALSVSMAQMQLQPQQQQQQQNQQNQQAGECGGAAGDSQPLRYAAWQAVCTNSFGHAAQRQLTCTWAGLQQQQAAGGSASGGSDAAHAQCDAAAGQPCWQCCLTAACRPTAASRSGSTARLPCSLLPLSVPVVQDGSSSTQPQRAGIAPVFALGALCGSSASLEQQQQHLPAAAAAHITGLLAAWLSPGFSLGNSGLQLPVQAALVMEPCATGSGNSSSNRPMLLQLAAAAGSDCFGHLMVCGGLLQLLLHTVRLQQERRQQDEDAAAEDGSSGRAVLQWQCGGLLHLLLATLAAVMPQVKDPAQQQVLLAALNPEPVTASDAADIGWAWLRQQLSAEHSPAVAAAAARGLVAASNRLVAAAEDDGGGLRPPGAAAGVVLPLLQQQALLVAELMQALLLYAALWPGLTVRRLLQDGVQHRSQQPLVVQLLKGLAATVTAAAALQQSPAQGGAPAPGLLLDELRQLLLPAEPQSAACATEQQQPSASTTMALTEAQHQTAAALVAQLVSAGLIPLQQALWVLCLRPLQLLWQQGWGYVTGVQQLRLMLLLLQELLSMQPEAQQQQQAPPSSAVGDAASALSAPLAACTCPLAVVGAGATQQLLHLAGSAVAQQQRAAPPELCWLLLGLCRLQQLLQELAWQACRPDYKASGQAAGMLEALVARLASCGVCVQLPESVLEQGDSALTQQVLQQLHWQQRLLLSSIISTGNSTDLLLLPDSLKQQQQQQQQQQGLVVAAAGSQRWLSLLDCCRMTAVSDAHACELVQAVLAHSAGPAGGGQAGVATAVTSALAAAARSQLGSPAQLKRGLTLALGQFLPWAAEHEAARVLLRLVPVLLLQASTTAQCERQALQEAWAADMQLACKAAVLFLVHGKWPQQQQQDVTAAAPVPQAAGSEAQARQLAAEQCFRHVSGLAVHVMQQVLPRLASSSGGKAAAPSSAAAELQLLQSCTQEVCGLVKALSPQYDCGALSAVLLQLLLRLAGFISAEAAAQGHQEAGEAAVGSSWARLLIDGATSVSGLLDWVAARLAQLPDAMRGMLGPGVVHVCEQQLGGVLGRPLSGEEVDALEARLLQL